MCCINLSTEAILENYFGSPNFKMPENKKVEVWKIQSFVAFLSNNLPGYVEYDLSIEALKEVSKKNNFILDSSNKYIICNKELKDRQLYNYSFSQPTSTNIESTVDYFFRKNLHNKKIKPLELLVS